MKTRIFYMVFLVAALIVTSLSAGYPQEKQYPDKPIQLVVAIRAGAGVDIFFRMLSEELKKQWKVPVTVENQVGGGGAVAANQVATGRKDGYTLLGTIVGTLSSMTAAKPEGPINLLRDFDPVFLSVDYASAIFLVRSDSKMQTLKDVVDYARGKPGELICGVGLRGTEIYLGWEMLKRLAKVDIACINYSGTPEAVTQLLGGHVHICGSSDTMAKPYIDSGKVRGIVTDTKSLIFPNVPTWAESGYPEIDLYGSIGLLGPKGLPPTVIKAWQNALEVILKDPTFVASIRKIGLKTNFQTDTEKGRDFLKREVQKYSKFTPEELGWQ